MDSFGLNRKYFREQTKYFIYSFKYSTLNRAVTGFGVLKTNIAYRASPTGIPKPVFLNLLIGK
jgi:hypothetical protein